MVWHLNFNRALKAALQVTKYRDEAIALAKEKGIWVDPTTNFSKKEMKRMNKRDLKEELKAEEDAILMNVFREHATFV